MTKSARLWPALALLALPLVAGPLPSAKPEDVGMSTDRLRRINQMIQHRMEAGDLTGAVTIVARKGKVVHLEAQGLMDLDSKKPMTRETMFRVASMTKPVTGLAIMMMIEEGKVRLTDPVSRFIPEFKGMKVAVALPPSQGRGVVLETGGGTTAVPPVPQFYIVPAEREITVRDLLTHVSGLASGPMSNSETRKLNRRPEENLASYIPRLGTTPLEFQPGSRWAYSAQAGFDTLGRIVEIVSGMPLDQFFRQRIFDPLGMKDIAFWPAEEQWPRVASVYQRTAKGLVKSQNPNTMSSQVYFMGSGGLISTAADYLPMGVMLANGGQLNGKRLLSPKTVEMMRAVHVPDTLPGRAPGEGYGLSVRVVSDHAKRGTLLSTGSFGWSGAYGTHFFVDPVEQVVAVLMVQTANQEVNRDFEDMVMQAVVE
ncbi:MAG TPA: serine hydrolase domain-containing protein [Bryobacteraceae bacterium]|jgi:CubicO group peptidase (beta-lactamase class C family)|nr:serine hydrolase domain-containing protein [Bryobacteraceae bacterium]